jgi:ADP-ribose pyrophosphatase YjhB (NUDIX family)
MASFNIGAFAIIFDDQRRVLLCHRRDYDLWDLPGGGVDVHEAPWDAVIREVQEEVGLDVAVRRLAGVYSKPEQHEVVFSFVCSVVGGTQMLSDEADQIAYVAVADLPRKMSPKQIERIHDALALSTSPVLKTQLGPSAVELIRAGEL